MFSNDPNNPNNLIRRLRRRALKHDLEIQKDREGYILVDRTRNCSVTYPPFLSIEQVEQWLDDLDEQSAADVPF